MPLMWEQLPRESSKAFAAFRAYLDMGPDRSTAKAAKQAGKSHYLVKDWCRKYDWVARVQAHDTHLALVERQAVDAALRSKTAEWLTRQTEQREEEWKVRTELLEAGREALRVWTAAPNRSVSLEGIARMLSLATKLGRLASGMPTDHTEVTGEVAVSLDVEWEAALKKVYGTDRTAPQPIDAEIVDQESPPPPTPSTIN
jgi:hypothetical protein